MAGLLGIDDPRTQGLLSLAMGLLEAGGPQSRPVSFGQALARGGQMGMGAYQQGKDRIAAEQERALQKQLRELQMKQAQAALTEQEAQRLRVEQIRQAGRDSVLNRAGIAMMGGGGPTPQNAQILDTLPAGASAFDEQSFANRVMQIDPIAGLELQAKIKAANAPIKVGPEDVLLDARTRKPVYEGAGKRTDFERALARVYPVGSPQYNEKMEEWIRKQSSHAPGTKVDLSVNTERNLFGKIADSVASRIDTQLGAAQEAVTAIETAHSIKRAIDSGKAIVGVMGQKRLEWAQLATQLGIVGPDAVVQTRAVIQGLSKLALAARSSLKGQGQISDFEGKSLQKAEAGEFDAMSGPEIRAIADVAERGARLRIKQNAQNAKLLAGDKSGGAAPVLPFFDVKEPPPYLSPSLLPQGTTGQPSPNLNLGLEYLQRATGGR